MNQINTKRLKSSLSLEDHKSVCKALGIPIFAENSKQIIYYTGDKNVDPYKGSAKLVFYKDTDVYIGYTAGRAYDVISLTQQRLSLLKQPSSFIDAINFILSTTGKQIDSIQRINKPHVYDWQKDLEKFIRFKRTGSILPTYDPTILDQLETRFPQPWIDEGISKETMAKYLIRYYERCNQTCIPVFGQNGLLHGIRVRNWQPEYLEGKNKAKYMPLITLDDTCYKFDTNSILYGLNYNWPEIERTGTVYIGEGEKFVLKMDTWFHEKSCAVAMFGGSLGLKRRNDLVKLGVKRVVLVPDNDWIGQDEEKFCEWQKKIQKQVDLWAGLASVEVVWDNDDVPILEPKQNATDQTLNVWNRLYEQREICS